MKARRMIRQAIDDCPYCDKIRALIKLKVAFVIPESCINCPYFHNVLNRNLLEAKVNEIGDLVCPNCTANILTPPTKKIEPGIGKCSRCSKEFKITREVANLGNRIADGEIEL